MRAVTGRTDCGKFRLYRLHNEINPKSFLSNFWGLFMYKKHNYSALQKHRYMLEDGYSINYVHTNYRIDRKQLS